MSSASPQPSTRRLAIYSSIWTVSGYGFGQVLRLASHLVLAWLMAPEIFGIMALVKVVQQGLNMFSDIGIQPSIIQSPRGDEPPFLHTAWTIQVIRGVCLWIVACILAWPIAALFARNDPSAWQLAYLLPVTGFGAVITGFNSTSLATLNKGLCLGRITLLEIGTQVVSLGVMVVWAFISPTAWAMVAGGLVSAVFTMIISHRLVLGHQCRFAWDSESARELIGFGRWIFLSTAFTFVAMSADKIILGNVLPLSELGLYSIAYVFTMAAFVVATKLGGTVLFPVYSRYKGDPAHMMSVALRARRVVLWVGMGTCVSMAIASPAFFATLWDARYHETGPIAQWMATYVWTMILLLTMDRIPLALGNSRAMFFSNVWRAIGTVIAAGGYLLGGLPGFILGLSAGPLLAHAYLMRHIPANRRELAIQGVRFTLGGMAYAVPAVLLALQAQERSGQAVWLFATGVLAFIPLGVAGWVVWHEIRPTTGNRPQGPPSAPLTGAAGAAADL